MPAPEFHQSSDHLEGRAERPRTLVTGGAGFVGSHMCDRLLSEGHEVICLDNMISGRAENVAHLMGHPRFVLVRHDVTHPIDCAALLISSGSPLGQGPQIRKRITYVMHLASPASPKAYARHPIHTMKVGALGTYHALGVAKSNHSVFLLTSTSEVYGDPEISPQPESYWGHVNPIGPRSVYDEAKRYAEAITMAYAREHGVQVRIARLFNTYGERMRIDDGRALPNFLTQAIQEKPLTVYGDGSQTRSFCYVSDVVEGLYRLTLSKEIGPVNLGNPEEISLRALAKEVIELTQSPSSIVFEALPVDDPRRRRPDISRARQTLGWQPRVSRREGIERVIPYFRTQVGTLCAVQPGQAGISSPALERLAD